MLKKIETTADRGQKKSSTFVLENQRVSEICRLIRHRYGGACRTDDGSIWLEAVIPTLAVIVGDIDAPTFPNRIVSWAAEHVPVASEADIAVAISEARERNKRRRLMLKAAELGNLLNLTVAERQTLRIRTIRQAGVSDRELKALERAREAERQRKRRRKAGAKPRSESLAQKRPWEAEGISRRTYERQIAKSAAGAEADGLRDRTKLRHPQAPVGTVDSTDVANSYAIDFTSPSRTKLRHASTEPADASRADSTIRKRRRTTAASGKPANDNRMLRPYRPKRMAIVGNVNDNGGDD